MLVVEMPFGVLWHVSPSLASSESSPGCVLQDHPVMWTRKQ